MEREFICLFCDKPFQDPVILPCSHHACLKCAESLISYADISGKGTENGHDTQHTATTSGHEDSSFDGKVAVVLCPVCGKSICIGSRDAQSFPRNRILEKLVSRSFGAVSEIACEMCDTFPVRPGTISCEQCEITYCETCCRTFHPRRGPLALHVLVSPSSVAKTRTDVMKCCDHREENISMYCVKCKTTVCYLCVERGRHRKHDMKALGEMFKEQKVRFATYFCNVQRLRLHGTRFRKYHNLGDNQTTL